MNWYVLTKAIIRSGASCNGVNYEVIDNNFEFNGPFAEEIANQFAIAAIRSGRFYKVEIKKEIK